MTVAFVRKELKKRNPLYQAVRDCIEGEKRIKERGAFYLPIPNAADDSKENVERYGAYVTRAVFYPVTRRTALALCGLMFSKEPDSLIPASMEAFREDVDGLGTGLAAFSKRVAWGVLETGRMGVYVDFPDTGGEGVTAAQAINPFLTAYDSEQIINWKTEKDSTGWFYSLIVIKEQIKQDVDEFEFTEKYQYRVLRCDGMAYSVQIYDELMNPSELIFPKDATGQPFTRIPFCFVGAQNNTAEPDYPPLYDIASLNIAHYRNSADYEESSFLVGQPTPYFTGLTQQWVDEVLKGKIALGSRAAIPLPTGASAGLLQAAENTMPIESMRHKEEQMVAIGARLIEPSKGTKTATSSKIENASTNASLSDICNNVSEAIENAIKYAGMFLGVTEDAKFKLNTDFNNNLITAADRAQTVKEWQAGLISWEEVRASLKQVGIATLDDKKAQAIIDTEQQKILDQSIKLAGANQNGPN